MRKAQDKSLWLKRSAHHRSSMTAINAKPSLSREMHDKIAGSELVIFPNSGHMNFID
jgi:pimeloyl-ACP methyl ester carboxylesterase